MIPCTRPLQFHEKAAAHTYLSREGCRPYSYLSANDFIDAIYILSYISNNIQTNGDVTSYNSS